MVAIEFVEDVDYRRFFDPSLKIDPQVAAALLECGVIGWAVPQGDILGFALPLCLTCEEADTIIKATAEAFDSVVPERGRKQRMHSMPMFSWQPCFSRVTACRINNTEVRVREGAHATDDDPSGVSTRRRSPFRLLRRNAISLREPVCSCGQCEQRPIYSHRECKTQLRVLSAKRAFSGRTRVADRADGRSNRAAACPSGRRFFVRRNLRRNQEPRRKRRCRHG